MLEVRAKHRSIDENTGAVRQGHRLRKDDHRPTVLVVHAATVLVIDSITMLDDLCPAAWIIATNTVLVIDTSTP